MSLTIIGALICFISPHFAYTKIYVCISGRGMFSVDNCSLQESLMTLGNSLGQIFPDNPYGLSIVCTEAGQLIPHVVFSATFQYIFVFHHTSGGRINRLNQLAPASRGDY